MQASPLQATGRAPGTAAPTSVHTPLAASGGGGAKDAKRRLQIDPDYTVLEPDEGMGDPGACVRVGVWVCVGVCVREREKKYDRADEAFVSRRPGGVC